MSTNRQKGVGIGQKRKKDEPVLHSEVKKKRTIACTPTAWKILEDYAAIADLSLSESFESILRNIKNPQSIKTED